MSKSDTWESQLLKLVLQNIGAANIGDAAGLLPSAGVGSLYVSLHTADPLDAGTQPTSESAYTGYLRVAVVRSAAGWTVAGTTPTTATNAAAVTFPICTAGTSTVTFFGVGVASSGAGALLYSGALNASLAISLNITPSFAIGDLSITED